MANRDTDTFQIEFDLGSIHYSGSVTALLYGKKIDGIPTRFIIDLKDLGGFHLECDMDGCWHVDKGEQVAQELVNEVGDYIHSYYT